MIATSGTKASPLQKDLHDFGQLVAAHPLEAAPFGLEMDLDENAEKIEAGRNGGGLRDFDIGGVREFGHQKGRGAHDRGHDLAARRGGRLDGAGEFRPVAEFFFIIGMVKLPDPTVLATELPETVPSRALVMTATLAGPPAAQPAIESAMSMKSLPMPVFSRKAPKRINRKMNEADTPRGMPRIPSVVKYMWETIRWMEYPRWARKPGK